MFASRLKLAIIAVLLISAPAFAQWAGRDGWIEEPGAKSTDVEGSGHAYLDSTSVRRGDDGLIYFNESSNVSRPDQIGKVGLMEDAYDCTRNIKYMCVDHGDWRNDPQSRIDLTKDPAVSVYGRYLCGEDPSPHAPDR
jgi:hypothetical protein